MPDVSTNQGIGNTVSSYSINLFRQGIAYMESDKYSEALLCFEQVYKTDGQIPNLHYACAVAFMKLGRTEEAILACRSEIAKTPDHRDAIALLNGIISPLRPSWPESTYLVNHDYRFLCCPIPRVMSTNTKRAVLRKVAGLDKKHGHNEKDCFCKVHRHTNICALVECKPRTNGEVQRVFNDDRYFKFIIVRSPWRRLVSAYLCKLINGPDYWTKGYDKLVRQIRAENNLSLGMGSSVTFRQFIEHEVRKSDMEMNNHWKPLITFTAGHKFDFIAKLENIQNDLDYINKKLGFKLDVGTRKNTAGYMKNATHQDKYFCDCYADELLMIKENCGGHPGYKQFYPPELKELVARRYASDIKAFRYEF